jgi:hypothetical protein
MLTGTGVVAAFLPVVKLVSLSQLSKILKQGFLRFFICRFRYISVCNMTSVLRLRVRSQSGSEHTYEVLALKAYARVSRAASMLTESVYFPVLAAMMFDSCERNEALCSLLLQQTAAFARALRPLELFGETIRADNLRILVEVKF